MVLLTKYWPIVAFLVSALGIGLRISFQLGGLKQTFEDHVKGSHAAHTDIWKQLDWLRDRRR